MTLPTRTGTVSSGSDSFSAWHLLHGIAPGEDAVDGAAEPFAADGLQDEVDRLEVERLDGTGLVGRDEHDRGRLAEPRERAREVEPREPGHMDVEERGVHGLLREQAHGLGSDAARRMSRTRSSRRSSTSSSSSTGRSSSAMSTSIVRRPPPARATGARVSGRHPLTAHSVSLNGCDLGMRMRTIVPAPGFVSMTSA